MKNSEIVRVSWRFAMGVCACVVVAATSVAFLFGGHASHRESAPDVRPPISATYAPTHALAPQSAFQKDQPTSQEISLPGHHIEWLYVRDTTGQRILPIRYVRAKDLTRQERVQVAESLQRGGYVAFQGARNLLVEALGGAPAREGMGWVKFYMDEIKNLRLAITRDGAVVAFAKIDLHASRLRTIEVERGHLTLGIGSEFVAAIFSEFLTKNPFQNIRSSLLYAPLAEILNTLSPATEPVARLGEELDLSPQRAREIIAAQRRRVHATVRYAAREHAIEHRIPSSDPDLVASSL